MRSSSGRLPVPVPLVMQERSVHVEAFLWLMNGARGGNGMGMGNGIGMGNGRRIKK